MAKFNSPNAEAPALNPSYGGAAFSLNVIIFLVLSLVSSGIILASGANGTDAAKYIQYLVSPTAIIITFLVFAKYTKLPPKTLIPVKTHPKYFLIGLMLIFGLLFSLSSLNEYFVRLLELMGYERKSASLPSVQGWNILPVLLVVAVVPAVAEEILFRSLILFNAEEGCGSVRTVFLVGLCFSLYHGSVEQTIYQFICGCLFALLAIRSRSITATVVIHFINNALIIILSACGALDGVTGDLILPLAGKIVLYVLSGVCLIGAVVWLILDKSELKNAREGGVKKFFLTASLGLIATIILWVVSLF